MYNEGTLSHPFQCNFRLMQNAACAVLFKYMHYGSNRHDEWLLICPQGKQEFRKAKRGHRAYGSCGAWHVDGDNLMLTGWACREGAKKHDLTFKKTTTNWENGRPQRKTWHATSKWWAGVPSLMICDVPHEDRALLALAESTEQVVEAFSSWFNLQISPSFRHHFRFSP